MGKYEKIGKYWARYKQNIANIANMGRLSRLLQVERVVAVCMLVLVGGSGKDQFVAN